MERIEIPFSRPRLTLYIIASLLLLSSFIYAVYSIAEDVDGYIDVMMLVGCALGLIVPVYGLLLYGHKALFVKHGLVITHDGIVNNAGYTYWGLILWKDLYDVHGLKNGSNYLIWLGIHQHKVYAHRMNPIRRWLVRNDICFYKMLPSPLINAALLKCKPEELERTLNAYLLKYGKKTSL